MLFKSLLCLSALATSTLAEVYFKETFDGDWEDRWVLSTKKGAEQGDWRVSAGKWYRDAEEDKGLQTTQDAKFYGASAKFPAFSNEGKKLVIQYQVKHEQKIDCGGGYLKILGSGEDQEDLHGETPYNIMFGPDICGTSAKRVHVIFTYKGKNLLRKTDIPCKDDDLSHLYTLEVNSDNTYAVYIDGKEAAAGGLEADFDFLPPREIDDSTDKMPEDWDEREKIPDPNDKKPDGYDDIPEFIPDDSQGMPEDWDEEEDGEWEAPMKDNPEYKGEWSPALIANPDYNGKWAPKKIPNPDYTPDDTLYKFEDFGIVGLDLWQVKSGTIFDNIFIGDDLAEAQAFAAETFDLLVAPEKEMKEEVEKQAREEAEAAEALEEKEEL